MPSIFPTSGKFRLFAADDLFIFLQKLIPNADLTNRDRAAMEKKVVVLLSMILLIISANVETVESQGVNCYDNCNTGCAGLEGELYLECDQKCHIRCDEVREVNEIEANGDALKV